MKNINILFAGFLILTINISISAQAKKPQIMIVPDDVYCIKQGYSMKFDNQGTEENIPDYKKALQNDQELIDVIATINRSFLDRGFGTVLLKSQLDNLSETEAELNALTSKSSGAKIKESPTDILKRKAKADIIVKMSFEVRTQGPRKFIKITMEGVDAYTNKSICSQVGEGTPALSSNATILTMTNEAVLTVVDNFLDQLNTYFQEMFEIGRECKFRIQVFDSSPVDLEEEYIYNSEELELGEHIDNWFAKNSVSGRFNNIDGSENFLIFSARIPLYDENGTAMDAKRYMRDLRKLLKEPPYNLEIKIYQRGLGEAWLIIGEK